MERDKRKKKEEEERQRKHQERKRPLWAEEDENESIAEARGAGENGGRDANPKTASSQRKAPESDEELPDDEQAIKESEPVDRIRRNEVSADPPRKVSPPPIFLTPEEKDKQFALNVKRFMTEILVTVLTEELDSIAAEELRRARNRVTAKPKKVTSALANIVGIGECRLSPVTCSIRKWNTLGEIHNLMIPLFDSHPGGYSDSDASDNEGRNSDGEDDVALKERISAQRKAFRKWEETAMRELEEREVDQQRRMRREESPSSSPQRAGGQDGTRPGPRTSSQSPSHSRRSRSRGSSEGDSGSRGGGRGNSRRERSEDRVHEGKKSREKNSKEKRDESSSRMSARNRTAEGRQTYGSFGAIERIPPGTAS